MVNYDTDKIIPDTVPLEGMHRCKYCSDQAEPFCYVSTDEDAGYGRCTMCVDKGQRCSRLKEPLEERRDQILRYLKTAAVKRGSKQTYAEREVAGRIIIPPLRNFKAPAGNRALSRDSMPADPAAFNLRQTPTPAPAYMSDVDLLAEYLYCTTMKKCIGFALEQHKEILSQLLQEEKGGREK